MVAIDCCYGMVSCLADVEHEQTPGIRFDKVLYVRRKLRSGKYNISEHLDVAIDKLLEDILVQEPEE